MEKNSKSPFRGKRIWMYWPDEDAALFDENYEQGFMACSPKQGEIGDMNKIMRVRGALDAALLEVYDTRVSANGARKLLNEFCQVMQEGDFVIARCNHDFIIGIGVVTSDYFYDDNRSYFKHCRKVNWLKRGKWRINDFFKSSGKWHRVSLIDGEYRKLAEEIINGFCGDKL